MKYTILCLLIMNFLLLNTAQGEIEVGGFIIKAGLLRKIADQNYITYKETMQIPLILKKDNPGFWFGYTIQRSDGRIFRHRVILTIPGPQHYTGDINSSDVKKISDGRVEIVHKEITNKDYGYSVMRFDEGDVEGLYQMKVYIDKKLLTTIDYDVKKKKVK